MIALLESDFQTIRFRCPDSLGSLSNAPDDGDGNENGKLQKVYISKTTTLHVHQACSYIPLPSLHDYDLKVPNFTFCGGRKHKTTIFFFSSWTLMQSFRIHLQQKSATSVTLKLGEIDAVKFETERKFTLSPKSDQHQICPCNINAFYDRVVMRITDMITRDEFTWYFINFSPLLLRKWIGTTSENSNFDLRV